TFLYEFLWNLLVAGLLLLVDRRWRLGRGRLFFLYVALYTIGRLWIEALRIDTAEKVLGLRVNIWVSIGVFLLALLALALVRRPVDPNVGWPAPVTGGNDDGDARGARGDGDSAVAVEAAGGAGASSGDQAVDPTTAGTDGQTDPADRVTEPAGPGTGADAASAADGPKRSLLKSGAPASGTPSAGTSAGGTSGAGVPAVGAGTPEVNPVAPAGPAGHDGR
ncbi:prolipoprotein diacylglyceryl transferase family protein, partial [Frankia sp. EI5c]|uniref:prolipoprotein diacylglyceryl transferase family protein n=1 Tax=Frankia sp. EI5c TaxID=683316 RepID=UPI001F5B9A08